MRIGVAATPEVAIPTLDWLARSVHELPLIISQPDQLAGRGRTLRSSPVSTWALARGGLLIRPDSFDELAIAIEGLDLVLTIGYGRLIPEKILKIPKHGFINLHFSLLPAYRGAAPVQRAIEAGESQSGVTVFALEKGMDTGPIYSSGRIQIEPTWRAHELFTALAAMSPQVVESALHSISIGKSPTAQSGQITYAPKISKEEARIDWSSTAQIVLARIRGFYPAPVAWTLWQDENFRVTSAQELREIADRKLEVGEILVVDNSVLVGCAGFTSIELLSVIASGKREMAAIDWARGAHLRTGSLFG